jgi:hypothetical protein
MRLQLTERRLFSESLRDRVANEQERFNEAFSAAANGETPQYLEDLTDAADRLMRAVGRVLIEAKRQLGDRSREARSI